MVELAGRLMDRTARVRALRTAVAKRRRTLTRAMAHCPEPWPADLERFERMHAAVLEAESVLARVLAGEDPPPSPVTAFRTRLLPDRIGGPDDASLIACRRLHDAD